MSEKEILERKIYLENLFYNEDDNDVTFQDLEDIACELIEMQYQQ